MAVNDSVLANTIIRNMLSLFTTANLYMTQNKIKEKQREREREIKKTNTTDQEPNLRLDSIQ